MGGVARGLAGGVGHHGFIIVTQSGDGLGVSATAVGAGVGLDAVLGTSGGGGNCAAVFVGLHLTDIAANVTVTIAGVVVLVIVIHHCHGIAHQIEVYRIHIGVEDIILGIQHRQGQRIGTRSHILQHTEGQGIHHAVGGKVITDSVAPHSGCRAAQGAEGKLCRVERVAGGLVHQLQHGTVIGHTGAPTDDAGVVRHHHVHRKGGAHFKRLLRGNQRNGGGTCRRCADDAQRHHR